MAGDPSFANVVLLLHFDGANGSTTVPDSSLSAHTVTCNGALLSTAQQKFGTASLLIGSTFGNVDHAYVAAGLTDFRFGSGRFTVETWVRLTSFNGAAQHIACAGGWTTTGNLGWKFGWSSGNLLFTYSVDGSATFSVSAAVTPSLNTWHHIAVDRDASNATRVYFNGAVIASATVASSFFNSTDNFYIGNDGVSGRNIPGYMDDLRVTKGVARYGGAFSVPTAAFPDTGTSSRRRPVIAICS